MNGAHWTFAIGHWPLAIGVGVRGHWPLAMSHHALPANILNNHMPHCIPRPIGSPATERRPWPIGHWPLATLANGVGVPGHSPLAIGHCGWDPWPLAIGYCPLGWGRRTSAIGHWPLDPLAVGNAHGVGLCTRTRTWVVYTHAHTHTHARTHTQPPAIVHDVRAPSAIGHWPLAAHHRRQATWAPTAFP